jgi:hypothetical protein
VIDFLLRLAAPALRFADNPNRNYRRVHLVLYTLIVALLDVLLAHTVWAWFFGFPQKGEWTISHTLERLIKTDAVDRLWLFGFAFRINEISPGHIKAICK